MEKRGQLGVFVIIALVILALVIVFMLSRTVRLPGADDTINPQQYLSSCLEPVIRPMAAELAAQGSYREPTGFIVYNDTQLPYLCYTSEYYKPCVIQQSDVLGNFERSLNAVLSKEVERCTTQLESDAGRRGYRVARTTSSANASIVPGKIQVQVRAPMTLTRDVSRTYQSFDLAFASEYYDLLSIATSILDFESSYGDAEITTYLQYYPDLTIRKNKLSDGTKIYTLRNGVSHEEFTFATRSLVWGAGYPSS